MKQQFSPLFDAKNDQPVNPGRYECELIQGIKAMIYWDGLWELQICHIKFWRGQLRYCKKCGGMMAKGKAIAQTFTGLPDFADGAVVTVSPGGKGKLMDCAKCVECGWSVSL